MNGSRSIAKPLTIERERGTEKITLIDSTVEWTLGAINRITLLPF